MRENGMWHFPTYEIGVKLNDKGEISEVGNFENISGVLKIKISKAILSSIENGDENIIERMNSIYGEKVAKILKGEDEVVFKPYVHKRKNSSDIVVDNVEVISDNNVVYALVDDLGNIKGILYNEESIRDDSKYVRLIINAEELKDVKYAGDYENVFKKLGKKYKSEIMGDTQEIDNESRNFINNLKNKLLSVFSKNAEDTYSTNEI